MADIRLEPAIDQAVSVLKASDPVSSAHLAGVVFNASRGCFTVPFLEKTLFVSCENGRIVTSGNEPVQQGVQLLTLHYLNCATGMPLTKRWITFRQLPGGDIYVAPFQRRSVQRLVSGLGNTPERLRHWGERLGGHPIEMGDTAVVLPVFPRVPIVLVLWRGDEEFPATGNILFDEAASQYLPTEDYAQLAGMVTQRALHETRP